MITVFVKSIGTTSILLVVLLVNGFSNRVLGQEALSQVDKTEINRVLDALSENYEKGNLKGVMALFADEAVLLEGRGMNNGKKAIEDDHLGREFRTLTFTVFKPREREIKGNSRIAYAFEILKVQIKRNSEEKLISDPRDRRSSYVLKKQSDGSWKIVLWHI